MHDEIFEMRRREHLEWKRFNSWQGRRGFCSQRYVASGMGLCVNTSAWCFSCDWDNLLAPTREASGGVLHHRRATADIYAAPLFTGQCLVDDSTHTATRQKGRKKRRSRIGLLLAVISLRFRVLIRALSKTSYLLTPHKTHHDHNHDHDHDE